MINPLEDHQTQQCDAAPDLILAEMNPWARYKQAMRELDKRRRGYQEAIDDNELLLLDIEEKESELEKAEDKRRNTIELRRLRRRYAEGQRVMHDIAREGSRFLAEVLSLKGKFGELTLENRRELDLRAWEHEFLCEIATSLVMRSQPNPNSLKNLAKIRGAAEALTPIVEDPIKWLEENNTIIPNKLHSLDVDEFILLVDSTNKMNS